jgi:predicted DNA-binding protein (MmcQ/YjbR family)
MTFEEIRVLFLSFNGSEETFPFGPDVPVYKVGGKMFALASGDRTSINLKNDPNDNQMLRLSEEGITPGYHMNKRHWNTVDIERVDDNLIGDMIMQSYTIVYQNLPKKIKIEIEGSK